MATSKARKHKVVQAPRPRAPETRARRRWLPLAAGAAVVLIAIGLLALQRRDSSTPTASNAGLPNTSDYHSLLVDPADPNDLILGTHQGLYRSTDGGRNWTGYSLAGKDAMNLTRRGGDRTIWLAGHNVFAKSDDGGSNWQQLQQSSLPNLDLHGFAVDPRRPSTVYAAVAGFGLYRSTDRGVTFHEISKGVGGTVMALAVTRTGEILAGDMQRGLLSSRDAGKTWRQVLDAQLAGIAINPQQPETILATGPGILRSTDGGSHWSQVERIDAGAGPVTWSPSNSHLAYVVGFDRVLYRSSDDGASWAPVG